MDLMEDPRLRAIGIGAAVLVLVIVVLVFWRATGSGTPTPRPGQSLDNPMGGTGAAPQQPQLPQGMPGMPTQLPPGGRPGMGPATMPQQGSPAPGGLPR